MPKLSGHRARGRAVKKRGRERVKTTKRLVPFIFFMFLLTGTCLFLYSAAVPDLADSAPSDNPGLEGVSSATANDAKIKVQGNIISATGTGRVAGSSAQSRLLGRRAAITDARRNLLAYRQKLAADPNFRQSGAAAGVSGFLTGMQRIKSESVEGGVYFVELEMRLDDLLRSNFDENLFITESNDLYW